MSKATAITTRHPGKSPLFQKILRCSLPVAVLLAQPLPSLADSVPIEGAEREALAALFADYVRASDSAWTALSAADAERLSSGETLVRVVAAPDGPGDDEISAVGVYALRLMDSPRLLVWLSLMGANDERDYRLTRAMLSRGTHGSYVRYQHVNLPWPIRDRHWVIECVKNIELADSSDGAIWEHRWQLHAQGEALLDEAYSAGTIDGLTRKDLRKSVYLPVNRGSWTLLDADGQRTLIVAWIDTDLGGRFPDGLVRAFARRRLKAGLETLAQMASRVHDSYNEMPLIHDGHGRPISRQAALDTARIWRDTLRIAARD